MERLAFTWRVRPGRTEDYRTLHATIWPELAAALRAAGVHEFSIYLDGEQVLGHLLVESFEHLVTAMANDPVSSAWEEQFADVLEYPGADAHTGWPRRLERVWDLVTDNPVEVDRRPP